MQPRLMRSRTEVIVAGVCGGLGEYFGIDPVIIRLIFVLATITTGLGFIVYPVLWLVMPKAGVAPGQTPLIANTPDEWRQRINTMGQEMAEAGQQMREVFLRESGRRPSASATPPPPEAYNFDPLTGQPVKGTAPTPTIGRTINLRVDATTSNQYASTADPNAQHTIANYQQPVPPPARKHNGRTIGIVLVAFGALVLAGQFGVAHLLFPLLMIVAGVMLLRKK